MNMKIIALGLLALVSLGTAPAPGAIRVYGEARSTGPTIEVQVFADIPEPAIVSYSFKLFYPENELRVQSASPNEAVWYFFDGSRPVRYPGPDTSTAGEILFVGGRMDARAPLQGVTGEHVLLATAVFRRSSSEIPRFGMSIGRPGQFANFVTTEGKVLEASPGQIDIQVVTPDVADTDLDGLTDEWEEKFFGSPKDAFYTDDKDRDGVNNLGEQEMGSDPTDAASNLRLAIQHDPEIILLEWNSVEGRRYTIEAAKALNRFEVVQSEIGATPPVNTLKLSRKELGEVLFFRVRVERTPAK